MGRAPTKKEWRINATNLWRPMSVKVFNYKVWILIEGFATDEDWINPESVWIGTMEKMKNDKKEDSLGFIPE